MIFIFDLNIFKITLYYLDLRYFMIILMILIFDLDH